MERQKFPVYLEHEKCKGCVSCMKRCPTEAIRVRGGKAVIMHERCIACGECVKVCPTQAKKERHDSISEIHNYKYTICIPCPSLYGQFNNLNDINFVLTGLKKLGFDEVFEAAYGAEIVSEATKIYLKNPNTVKPVVSSACSAITNLILMRYEHLIPHLSPMLQHEQVAAGIALKRAMEEKGLERSDIGVFVITQCASKVVELKKGEQSKNIDGVLSAKDIYFSLLAEMNKLESAEDLTIAGKLGISWGCTTGEALGLGTENFLSAHGLENVMEVLNELEHDKLNQLDFLELYACPSGCVGGSMNIENPCLARTRLRLLRKKIPMRDASIKTPTEFMRSEPYVPLNIFKLDDDRAEAMKKTLRMKEIYDALPQIDCGACGAPRCMAFAEDVVKGLNVSCKYKANKE